LDKAQEDNNKDNEIIKGDDMETEPAASVAKKPNDVPSSDASSKRSLDLLRFFCTFRIAFLA
jgi:hypothetical protein